jgi:hypothetical protein
MGKVVQPLQSVNYQEWHGPFTRLVWGYGWDGPGWVYTGPVGLVHGMQQLRSLCAWFSVWLQVGCL